MDYAVARMQPAGHTTPAYHNATAVLSVPHSIADHRPPPVSQRTRGSALMQRQRREALEQEVSELKQQLSNEETVHQILERALQQPSGSSSMALTNIPAFIPTKAKELLAELLLVEQEIARLEDQIHRMKQGAGSGSGSGSGGGGANSAAIATITAVQQQQQQPLDASCCSNNDNNNGRSPRLSASVTKHCKSMFFISQAMDGEAYLSKVKKGPSPRDDYRRHATNSMMSPKNNVFGGAGGGLPPRHSLENKQSSSSDGHGHVVVDNNSTTSKPPPQTPSKILQTYHNHELPITKNPTVIAAAKRVRDQPQPPNKLSERIVKCLICIFMRLLRSSRASEMDKSGSLAARAGNSFSSFRMDTGLVNAAAAAKEKERGQQDHYGIFGIQDAIVRDIGPYKNLVRFTSTSLDLLRGFSASPLLTKLREMLEALQQVDVRPLNHHQRLAFWLNIYNTCIMHGILQHGLPSNSDKLLALKNKATINVSGQTFNALVIENFILRQPSSVKEEFWKCDVDVEEQAVREVYGLKTSEPNILFALCCGIRSSPALRIYKPDRVVVDLEKAKLEYLQASLVVTSTRRLMIPSLVHSNMHDFAKDMESLLRWICEQLPTSWSLRKSMVDCLTFSSSNNQARSHNVAIHIGGGASSAAASNSIISSNKMEEVVDVIPLDYDFQYLLPM